MAKRFLICFSLILLIVCNISFVFAAPEGEDTSGGINGLLDGLKNLFVPSDDFFDNYNKEIQAIIDKKTGGLASSYKAITDQFKHLETGYNGNHGFVFSVPKNGFFDGFEGVEVDIFGSKAAQGFFDWIKPLISGVLVIVTVIFSYRKIINMFKGAGS